MTPQQTEALKLALEALGFCSKNPNYGHTSTINAITAIKEALAQPEQKPWCMKMNGCKTKCADCPDEPEQDSVAWLLTDKNINSLQVDSIQRLINRLNHAHHTDLRVRINGQDEWFQADWLKHMVRATPPKREWVGLMDAETEHLWEISRAAMPRYHTFKTLIEKALRERNT